MPVQTPEERAVQRGYWTVSLPAWLIMMAIIWPPICMFGRRMFDPSGDLWIMTAIIASALVAAWLFWAIAIPRWRLWAYERVSDIALLQHLAAKGGLVRLKGDWFKLPEIAPRELRERLAELELASEQRAANRHQSDLSS